MLTVTVSQLNRYVKAVLEEDKKLSDLFVQGEISNFVHHHKSGHFYFSLKDAGSSVRAVMFARFASRLPFVPESGMAVTVRADIGVYERDGVYQLYVNDIQPDGAGAMAVAVEQRKARLAARGLFDPLRKRPLPPYPGVVGVVTSGQGAALQDIVQVLGRRYPAAGVLISPAQVQGEGASRFLIRALQRLAGRCDVAIIGRGGGSAEDLWAFQDEGLAQAVADFPAPVISAVGHETDFTICDLVADLRAPTPSAAAELAVPDQLALRERLDRIRRDFRNLGQGMLEEYRDTLDSLASHPALRCPEQQVEKKRERLDFLSKSLYNNKNVLLDRWSWELAGRSALLDSLSPLRVLERGYCVVYRREETVPSAGKLCPGDGVTLRFQDGRAEAQIHSISEDNHEKK